MPYFVAFNIQKSCCQDKRELFKSKNLYSQAVQMNLKWLGVIAILFSVIFLSLVTIGFVSKPASAQATADIKTWITYIGKDGQHYKNAFPSCPPVFDDPPAGPGPEDTRRVPPNSKKNLSGGPANDWVISTHSSVVTDGEMIHRLHYAKICDDTNSFTFKVVKMWEDGERTIQEYGPVGEVPGAPKKACPYPENPGDGFGINGEFFGPSLPGQLPQWIKWYSKNPVNKEVQITTFDTATGTFSQTRVKPGGAGYPPPPPPGVTQEVWSKYLEDDPVDSCTLDADFDGLEDMEELMIGTNSFSVDSDSDGVGDYDEFKLKSSPTEALSTPENLGYGNSCSDQIDNDADGQIDQNDSGCVDQDSDTISDAVDNCVAISNQDQVNFDGDLQGGACDSDDDNDLVIGSKDVCPNTMMLPVDESGCGPLDDNPQITTLNNQIANITNQINNLTSQLKQTTNQLYVMLGIGIAIGIGIGIGIGWVINKKP